MMIIKVEEDQKMNHKGMMMKGMKNGRLTF